eukprot:2911078-Prymnesium_polylepis.1
MGRLRTKIWTRVVGTAVSTPTCRDWRWSFSLLSGAQLREVAWRLGEAGRLQPRASSSSSIRR